MKRLALTVALIFALSFFTGVLSACEETADDIFIVGYLEENSPLTFTDADGLASGFDIALASAVFDKLEMKVKFIPVKRGEKEKVLAAGQVDALWGGIIKTEDLENQFLLTGVYLTNSIAVAVRLDSPIKEIAGIPSYAHIAFHEDMSAFVMGNTVLSSRVTQKDETFVYSSTVKLTANSKSALNGVKEGLYTAAAADMLSIRSFNENESGISLKVLQPALGTDDYAVALRKGEEALIGKINAALYELQESGYLRNLASQWAIADALAEIQNPTLAE